MAHFSFFRRHRSTVASASALALAAGAVMVYAINAQGYQAHEAELNDGGIWVVNGKDGLYGRLNKPINQLDNVVRDERSKLQLDVVQEGAAVVGINVSSGRASALDPAEFERVPNSAASLPTGGDIQMLGSTLASLDTSTGELWAMQVDPIVGRPAISPLDKMTDPTAQTGKKAALAVSQSGTIYVTSADDAQLFVIEPRGEKFAKPVAEDLPGDAGNPTSVTTVGEQVVTLDAKSGQLSVRGGPSAQLGAGSVLQQPGPDADSVLVASPDGLIEVDLSSGKSHMLTDTTGRAAAPVRLGACAFAAWSGGQGALAVSCSGAPARVSPLGSKSSELEFRVNRGQIILNDLPTGALWDVEQAQPVRIDNWDAFTATKQTKDKDQKDNQNTDGERQPPKAVPDNYGARASRTTVLHPLDNDSAPSGRLLSIINVDQPGNGATATISPDGQTVQLTMPEKPRSTSFRYTVDDGRGIARSALISVEAREGGDNTPPTLRKGYKRQTWRVPAGGAMSVPVLGDWRDDADGDALMLDTAEALDGRLTGAFARTTAEGRIRFSAPPEGGNTVRVEYTVADGRSVGERQTMLFQILPESDQRGYPPTANPDVVRGEVGKPIVIKPTANDMPGTDPSNPQAELSIAGKIPNQPGAQVQTDLQKGIVRVTSDKAGTYFFDYEAAYGNAPLDQSKIRVDVQPAVKAQEPVSMPDTLTVYGQSAGIVDVLANDFDPGGGLLTVQRAVPDNPGGLDVAIIDGRWLRISSRLADLAPNPQVVRYTVTNGSAAVQGEVVVSQRPVPEDNSPVTVTDRVTVRAGAAVMVPVLDNDLSPSGDKLSLLTDNSEGRPGQLKVVPPIDVKSDPGQAYVTGRVVRYVAPTGLKEPDTYEVNYIATNNAGQTTPGRLLVTITPDDKANSRPEPSTLEARTVEGDTVKIRLPGSGVDPDGDPVTATGISSAPRLGRILSVDANVIEYEAYPGMTGTDEFQYVLTDPRGAQATGLVRVAVTSSDEPQPPLAVNDTLTVAPGRPAILNPAANDFVAPGANIKINLIDPPQGASVDKVTGLVTLPSPKRLEDPPTEVVYEIDTGYATSRAVMKVRTAPGYNNPPVLYDSYGKANDSERVVADVLKGAYDPDGGVEDLRLVSVAGDGTGASISGDRVSVLRTSSPQVVAFRVEDADKGAASANLYVPPTGVGMPYVKPDALIDLEAGNKVKADLSDYIVNPGEGTLRLVGGNAVSASPARVLQAVSRGDKGFEVAASKDYRGPGAVLVKVTTATANNGNENPTDPTDGVTALLSIPVTVGGDTTPVLTCPDGVLSLQPGGERSVDITSYCSVWMFDKAAIADVDYSVEWGRRLDGLQLTSSGSSVTVAAASSSATRGGVAVVKVRAGDSNVEEISFNLEAAPRPTMLPISLDDVRAGKSKTVDLARYLRPGVSAPRPTVVAIRQTRGPGVPVSKSGSSVTFRPGSTDHGSMAFSVVMSDVAEPDPPRERTVESTITFSTLGVPSPPGYPVKVPTGEQSETIRLSWPRPKDDGGAPILYYEVRNLSGGGIKRCPTNMCDIGGLKANSTGYHFVVRAVNKVGPSEWSERSKRAMADTRPGRVNNIRMVKRGDRFIKIAWDKPTTDTSKIEGYLVTWANGQQFVSDESITITGLDNNQRYTFAIKAKNKVGYSSVRESSMLQSLGTPLPPAAPAVTDLETGLNSTSVKVSWNSVLPEGPDPVTYTVKYSMNGRTTANVPGCTRIEALQCLHSGLVYNGDIVAYSVTAYNGPGNSSAPSAASQVDLVGKPMAFGAWAAQPTGKDRMITVSGVVPEPRGTTANVAILAAGGVAAEFVGTPGNSFERNVALPSNETPHGVQLRICNEKNACTVSDIRNVQSFGDLLQAHLSNPTVTSVAGKTMSVTVSGTGNGRPAQLRVTATASDGTQVLQNTVDVGPGSFSAPFSFAATDFDQSVDIWAELFDPGMNRGRPVSQTTATSGQAPAVTFGLRIQMCTEGAGPAWRNCNGTERVCNAETCGNLVIDMTGYLNRQINCTASPTSGGTVSFTSNSALVTDSVYDKNLPGGQVTVTCKEQGTKRAVGVNTIVWPQP